MEISDLVNYDVNANYITNLTPFGAVEKCTALPK